MNDIKKIETDFKETVYLHEVVFGMGILSVFVASPIIYWMVTGGMSAYVFPLAVSVSVAMDYFLAKALHPWLNRAIWSMLDAEPIDPHDVYLYGTVLVIKGRGGEPIKSLTRGCRYSPRERGAVNAYFSKDKQE